MKPGESLVQSLPQQRVADMRHFEVQQLQSSQGPSPHMKTTSQSQLQHFKQKSNSVQATPPVGQHIARAANTTGMMPAIHKQVAFPNLKNPSSLAGGA